MGLQGRVVAHDLLRHLLDIFLGERLANVHIPEIVLCGLIARQGDLTWQVVEARLSIDFPNVGGHGVHVSQEGILNLMQGVFL